MTFTLDGFRDATQTAASWAIQTTFQGISLASQGVSKGASLAGQGALWIGREVQVLSGVATDAVVRAASVTAKIAAKAFSNLASLLQLGWTTAVHFAKTHPRDIKVGLGSAAAAVALVILVQNVFGSKKETAKANLS